ncbi:mitochondrial dicarboxylate carrier [Fusarium sp. NRRL 52700]|nr:mitochondrial dicarboxylate carrier [Fusarium sp. NRRL 52700]
MNEPKQQPPPSSTRKNVPFEALYKHEPRQGATSATASRTEQPFWLAGAAAGGAALFTYPLDLVKARLQTDAALPPGHRRGYASVFHGLVLIIREEGLSGMFRGLGSNVGHGALMTASQIGSYDIFKAGCLEHLSMRDGIGTHLIASTMARLTATTVCSPVDVVKTRVMISTNRASIGSILTQAWRQDGVSWAFKGWTPSFMRLGP